MHEVIVSGASRVRSRSQISNISAEGSQLIESSADEFSLKVALRPLSELTSLDNRYIDGLIEPHNDTTIGNISLPLESAVDESEYHQSFTTALFQCLDVLSFNYSVSLDARLSACASFCVHSILSGKELVEKTRFNDDYVQDCSDECFEFIAGLFKGDWKSLDCNHLSDDRFTSITCAVVMNKEHSVCDSALSVLRRQYGLCPSFNNCIH